MLGYTTWRDTKVVILVFNKNKNFSQVLAQIPEVVSHHRTYEKRQDRGESESRFRFLLHHPDDPERKMTTTILAFDVPRA